MLIRYEPWNAVRRLHNVWDRAEDGSDVATSAWMPAVDIKEEDERFLIAADLPGVDPENIDVTMDKGMLTIKGERKVETGVEEANGGYRRVERQRGTFYRRFSLPESADFDRISANCRNGVLEVVIPKKAAIQPKRIQVAA